jgi:hypothetical protein
MSPDMGFVESKILYLLLLRSGKYSFLPDLFDAIGEDNDMMVRLLSMFAGQRITFPTVNLIAAYTRDIRIYYRLTGLTGRGLAAAIEELSAEYSIDEWSIRHKFRKMRGIAEDAGIQITSRR